MEYFITKHENTYTIAKFSGGYEPEQVYTVKGKSCDCPAGLHRGVCKHTRMIEHWREGHYYSNGILTPIEGYDHREFKV